MGTTAPAGLAKNYPNRFKLRTRYRVEALSPAELQLDMVFSRP